MTDWYEMREASRVSVVTFFGVLFVLLLIIWGGFGAICVGGHTPNPRTAAGFSVAALVVSIIISFVTFLCEYA